MSRKELEDAVLKLDRNDRAELANLLLESLDDEDSGENLSKEKIERLWAEEAVRRDEELESGKGQEIPVAEVLRELKTRYK